MSNSVQPHRQEPTRLPRPWDSPGKNTGVGCNFLLQFRKVKSESEVPQSCPTLSDHMDCSLPGSSILGFFQARRLKCLLLRRNHRHRINDTSLTQKWMFTCHLVISGPNHQDKSWGWECLLLCVGPLLPTVSASCRSPSPNIPSGISRWAPMLRWSIRGRCGAPSSQNTHIHYVPQGVNNYIWATRRNLRQSVSMFLEEIVQHFFSLKVFLMVFTFLRGILSPNIWQRKQRRCSI